MPFTSDEQGELDRYLLDILSTQTTSRLATSGQVTNIGQKKGETQLHLEMLLGRASNGGHGIVEAGPGTGAGDGDPNDSSGQLGQNKSSKLPFWPPPTTTSSALVGTTSGMEGECARCQAEAGRWTESVDMAGGQIGIGHGGRPGLWTAACCNVVKHQAVDYPDTIEEDDLQIDEEPKACGRNAARSGTGRR